MNISPRPYAGQGYRAGQESEEQAQDVLSQDNHGQNGRGNQQNQGQQNPETKTIARGRAPMTAHGGRKPFPSKPMSARQSKPIPMGRPSQPPRNNMPVVNNQSVPQPAPRMPMANAVPSTVPQQRQPIPNYQPTGQYQSVPQQSKPQSEVDPQAQQQINNMAKNNRVNIAQVIKDFRGTYMAIGTPQCLVDEVEEYLEQVIEHTKGEAPSINFVQTNLQNAAVIIDKYISETLDKDSKVVQNWLDALFLQRINYKYNDGEINEDFLVKFPEGGNAPQQPDKVEERAGVNSLVQHQAQDDSLPAEIPDYEPIPDYQPDVNQTVPIQHAQMPQQLEHPVEPVHQPMTAYNSQAIRPERVVKKPPRIVREQQLRPIQPKKRKPQITIIPEDNELKALFVQAKKQAYSNNPAKAMNIFKKKGINACRGY